MVSASDDHGQTIDLKKYYGAKPNITRALDGVNFSVEDGEFVEMCIRDRLMSVRETITA